MKCNPRVVSLKGIQVIDGTIEDGNQIRAFVGLDHGFFKNVLTVYRRPYSDKLRRLRSFKVPISKNDLLSSLSSGAKTTPISINLETNDSLLTLSGHLRIEESENSATLEVPFSGLVGYLEIYASRSSRIPGLTKVANYLLDKINNTDVLVLSSENVSTKVEA